MESGSEILRVTGAIVSAFQTAADAVDFIKDRKEKKRRKKDKEAEESLEIKILHKSLVEGGTRIRRHCENRNQQYKPAFEAGDDISIQALKDVVIALQTEIIQPLHVARAVENAALDFTALHESSVTNRNDATKAMDKLCQRIVTSSQYLPRHTGYSFGAVDSSNMSTVSSAASVPLSDLVDGYDLPSSPPSSVGIPPFSERQRALAQRTMILTQPNQELSPEQLDAKTPRKSPLSFISSQIGSNSAHLPESTQAESMHGYRNPNETQLLPKSYFTPKLVVSKNDRGSIRFQSAPARSASSIRHSQDTSSRVPSLSQAPPYQPGENSPSAEWDSAEKEKQKYGGYFDGDTEILSIHSKPASSTPIPSLYSAETVEYQNYGGYDAPEVVPDGSANVLSSPELSEKFPSPRFEPDYNARLQSLSPGLENIWAPLTRPAMHNRYHGFCKGAWQIRKTVHEGLEVQITPALKEPVLHWACKECKFKSRAPNADTLPDEILSNQKYNIRFRWLFLAKSHRSADVSIDIMENYKFGCIFCAAEGKTGDIYDKLDHLMVHVISKHKPITLTPETRAKTKCVVGNVAHHLEDWDIHVPESTQKNTGVATEQFLISASKFFSRKKGKR
ncbi:hypothetical protein P171DRAFT_429677 [Karstenula rhodostoma CBS 690.94]|uniref:Uncharacterized protein n=1 Tax=Karstenula rhodostoma CBS 690.94 TaxID=1392251 RepID=A0A9P4PKE7_9PLEO|nr:hypothetical protein P171DRAFT_429677 [Karstenula rhodostoma CBS 690.94]